VIWEASIKITQQAWFIKNFGANVNLGEILAPNEIIPLESLRLDFAETHFFQFLSRGTETVNEFVIVVSFAKSINSA